MDCLCVCVFIICVISRFLHGFLMFYCGVLFCMFFFVMWSFDFMHDFHIQFYSIVTTTALFLSWFPECVLLFIDSSRVL